MRTGRLVPSALTRSRSKRRVPPCAWPRPFGAISAALSADMISSSLSWRPATSDEVEPEPLGERGVDIFDRAVGIGGEEAGRRAVEIGDGRLHLGEARLLARAVHGDLVDLPHGERTLAAGARIGRHRLHRDAEPARRDPASRPRPRPAAAGEILPSGCGPAAPRATRRKIDSARCGLPAKARSGAGTLASVSSPSRSR